MTPPDRNICLNDYGECLTVPEVAEVLRVHPLTVYRAIGEGKLPATKWGRSYRISREALRAVLEGRA